MNTENHIVAVEARADALELQVSALAYEVGNLRLVVLALCNTLDRGLTVAQPDGTKLPVGIERIEQ